MSETKEDIENGNTKEAIEAQAQMNGDAHEPQEDEPEEKSDGKEQVTNGAAAVPASELSAEEEAEAADKVEEKEEEKGNRLVVKGKGTLRRITSFKLSKNDEAWRKKKKAQLRLDIPSAQREIPVLSVIPATGSASRFSQYNLECADTSTSSTTNTCIQCLFTAKLIWTLLIFVLNHITDAMAIEWFFRTGHWLFFVLSLIFYLVPITILCTYATNKLKRKLQWTWLDCVLNFFIAPYWLIIVNITNSLKNGRQQTRYEHSDPEFAAKDEILKDGKALAFLHSLEGALEAAPQVYIQIAAYMTLPITNMYDEVVARLPLTISVISVAWSVVANLEVGTDNVFWGGVHRFFAASEVGVAITTRAMVAGGLFLHLYPGIWQWVWLLPIVFAFLVTWFVMPFSISSFKDLLVPLKKGLTLPPADLESICGLMPFMVASLCLITSTYEPLLYFVGFEFLAGLSWFCFTLPKEGSNVLLDR